MVNSTIVMRATGNILFLCRGPVRREGAVGLTDGPRKSAQGETLAGGAEAR